MLDCRTFSRFEVSLFFFFETIGVMVRQCLKLPATATVVVFILLGLGVFGNVALILFYFYL